MFKHIAILASAVAENFHANADERREKSQQVTSVSATQVL